MRTKNATGNVRRLASPVLDMTMSWSAKFQDETTLASLHGLGVRMIGLTVGSDRTYGPESASSTIEAITASIANDPRFIIARSGADLQYAIDYDLLALELNFQGIGPLGGDLSNISRFAELGVRHIGICWNSENAAGGSATEPYDNGLTSFGRHAITEMERAGIIVDGAHAGVRTMMEAIEASTKPFIVSHTNCFAVTPARRSVNDDQIKACAASGGVLGMTGFGNDIGDRQASSAALFKHIDHVVQLVGPEHVGLGLDFLAKPEVFWEMVEASPQTWPDMEGNPMARCRFYSHDQLTQLEGLMLAAGYQTAHVRAIFGGNWQRICQAVWTS